MNVPKLRFKEFNDELSNYKFKDICTFFSGGTPTSSNKDYYNGNIPFIRSGEIYSDNTELFINQDAINNSSAKLVNKGDLLLALYGATSGNVAISKIDGAINQAILCIKPQYGYSKIFIRYLLENKKETILKTFLQGGQGNLSAEIIKNLNYSFPQIEEQEKIGNMLSLLDKKIELQTRKIEDLKLFKMSTLDKYFNKDTCKEKALLKKYCSCLTGKSKADKVDINGNYYIMDMGTVNSDGNILKTKPTFCNLDLLSYGDLVMPKDDIGGGLIIGKTGFIDEDNKYVLGDHVYLLKVNDINSLFLHYQINSKYINKQLKRKVTGSAQLGLKSDNILNQEIYIYSEEEQKKIANIFKLIDRKIELEIEKIFKLINLKKGLMQNMFV